MIWPQKHQSQDRATSKNRKNNFCSICVTIQQGNLVLFKEEFLLCTQNQPSGHLSWASSSTPHGVREEEMVTPTSRTSIKIYNNNNAGVLTVHLGTLFLPSFCKRSSHILQNLNLTELDQGKGCMSCCNPK